MISISLNLIFAGTLLRHRVSPEYYGQDKTTRIYGVTSPRHQSASFPSLFLFLFLLLLQVLLLTAVPLSFNTADSHFQTIGAGLPEAEFAVCRFNCRLNQNWNSRI